MLVRSLAALLVATAATTVAREPVVITLAASATPPAPEVTVAHVATLSGGNARERGKMAALDLTDRRAGASVSRKQVGYRLRLAGFSEDEFVLVGADKVAIGVPRRAITVDEVTAVAKAELARLLGTPADEQSFALAQPVLVKLPEVSDDDRVEITAVPHIATVRPGRTQMDMTVKVNGTTKLTFSVVLTTDTPAATPTTAGSAEVVPAGGVRAKPAGNQFAADAVLVRALQPVRLVVNADGMRLEAVAEAMQDGKVGQQIKVRNPSSKKVVTGTVVGANEVEVAVGGSR
ncbi:MAG: flagellar basal body P-ring formation chaperone FlgA [Gemmataceae bacterium]